ncbi:MAG: amidohydrolase family protein [Halothiobacillaceae bacterium]
MSRPALVLLALSTLLTGVPAQADEPLFDAHLHYSAPHAEALSPAEVIDRFDAAHVEQAIVTSTPPDTVLKLHDQAPDRIHPFLGLYRTTADKRDWMHDPTLPERLETALSDGRWAGIGEIHIFAIDGNSPVFARVVELAREHNLVLMIHGDPPIIDKTFTLWPNARVLWAHLGTLPEPQILREYLSRYPERLWIDTSVRDERIAPDGNLAEPWRALFLDFPDRFVVAVDTFSVNRWNEYGKVVAQIRTWLQTLPPAVRQRLQYRNAVELMTADTVDTEVDTDSPQD